MRLIGVVLGVVTCGRVHAADRFVSITGSDAGNDCQSSASPCATITHAVGQVASGDTIKVAQGLYREAVHLGTSVALTLSGSWRPDFSAQAPEKSLSRIQSPAGSAISVGENPGVSSRLTVARVLGSGQTCWSEAPPVRRRQRRHGLLPPIRSPHPAPSCRDRLRRREPLYSRGGPDGSFSAAC